MRVGSLFAGIGGFDLGLERAGFEIAWQVELDPYCQRVLAKHWPHVTRYGDIRSIDWRTVPAVDLICGGFPCQPFSLAGQRRGEADDRYLWPEMRLAICQVRPTWVLAENVPGLVGPTLDTVLSDLEAAGYETGTLAIPACAVDAPHIRQRLWIVAYTDGGRCSGRTETTGRETRAEFAGSGHNGRPHVAHAPRNVQSEQTTSRTERERIGEGRESVTLANTERRTKRAGLCADESTEQRGGRFGNSSRAGEQWPVESGFLRVAHGISNRVDRLRGLGNAIVPQIAEWLGRQIMACATK